MDEFEEAYDVTKQFIELVNELRSKRNTGPIAWNSAVKFLMARKFDVRRAVALYEAHERTRYREGLSRLDPTKEPLSVELETEKFTILPTRDKSGAAIAVFSACRHNPETASHEITLQAVVYQLDVALESLDTQRCGLIFIYNMTDSKYNNFDYELSQKILNMLKDGGNVDATTNIIYQYSRGEETADCVVRVPYDPKVRRKTIQMPEKFQLVSSHRTLKERKEARPLRSIDLSDADIGDRP
ncbi:Tyrosine-protein phosphatase non-receptor type 9 [Nymphon striatum]|nr:Tyrosine-protein phosphatase non-receptor type 9 [Nymphon striatum]